MIRVFFFHFALCFQNVYSSVGGHVGYLHIFAIVSNTAISFGVEVSEFMLLILVYKLLGHMIILCFNFLRSHQAVFCGGCTVLHTSSAARPISFKSPPTLVFMTVAILLV